MRGIGIILSEAESTARYLPLTQRYIKVQCNNTLSNLIEKIGMKAERRKAELLDGDRLWDYLSQLRIKKKLTRY